MKRFLYIIIFFCACKEAYNPHIKNANYNYLVVEGNIVAGNDSTIVHLSRTVAVSDTSIVQAETNATIAVEGEGGNIYQLQNELNGAYAAASLNINPNEKYRLHIFTADGKEYASDFVPVKQTPPIDSVSWKYNKGTDVNIYVSTHDATSNTQYYRWQFVETWEHRPKYSSALIYDPSISDVRRRLPEEQIYRCWNVETSGSIFIASTTGLSSDVVYEKQLNLIPYGSEKIDRVYSILVTQYALTKEAYEYWDNLKKNTESLGSIFDPQPFADFGNIKCITNPDEPVLGFISACSASEQRIYINWTDVQWPYSFPFCGDTTVLESHRAEVFSHTEEYIPIDYVFSPPGAVMGSFIECADCRLHGGSTIKPPYMP